MEALGKGYARELERRKQRKAILLAECERIFAGKDRIIFEAGCGHGHWLTNYAEINPEQTCVGIDLISHRIRKSQEKKARRRLSNLHFIKAELSEFLEVLPPHVRFDRTVLLFPDPWPKARHHRRRIVQAELLNILARRTDCGGDFCFRSDHRAYYEWTVRHLEAHLQWQVDPMAKWPHEMETYFQSLMSEYFSVIAVRAES